MSLSTYSSGFDDSSPTSNDLAAGDEGHRSTGRHHCNSIESGMEEFRELHNIAELSRRRVHLADTRGEVVFVWQTMEHRFRSLTAQFFVACWYT